MVFLDKRINVICDEMKKVRRAPKGAGGRNLL